MRDFLAGVLAPLGLRALRPDGFLMEVTADPDGEAAVVRSLVAVKKRPPHTMGERASRVIGQKLSIIDSSINWYENRISALESRSSVTVLHLGVSPKALGAEVCDIHEAILLSDNPGSVVFRGR